MGGGVFGGIAFVLANPGWRNAARTVAFGFSSEFWEFLLWTQLHSGLHTRRGGISGISDRCTGEESEIPTLFNTGLNRTGIPDRSQVMRCAPTRGAEAGDPIRFGRHAKNSAAD